ncbi:MAG: helix-turn-helix transcriptional regulator [Acidimicrobiia bacterium]
MNQSDHDLVALASLAEPTRRRLYDHVVSSHGTVSRDDAADAVGVSRQVAAYHLDRMADEGILDVEYQRLSGKSGPGAGRPSKLYKRSDRVYEVSLPARRYQLAAQILLQAVDLGHLEPSLLAGVARSVGTELGRSGLEEALDATGYQPSIEDGETRFRNCPFHALRNQDQDTTCGLNLALVEGMIEGAGAGMEAALQPEPGYCCVRLRPRD